MVPKTLVIIRGNSGSGKSSIATELRLKVVESGHKAALVQQDNLRRIILKEKEVAGGDNIDLIEQTALFALGRGYVVILEGILAFSRYGTMLERLVAASDRSLVFYMDVPFEETLRRHATKPNAHEFGEEEMRRWWLEDDRTGFEGERVIPAGNTVEDSVREISGSLRAS